MGFGVPESRTLMIVEMGKHSSRTRLGQSVEQRQWDDGGGQPGGWRLARVAREIENGECGVESASVPTRMEGDPGTLQWS